MRSAIIVLLGLLLGGAIGISLSGCSAGCRTNSDCLIDQVCISESCVGPDRADTGDDPERDGSVGRLDTGGTSDGGPNVDGGPRPDLGPGACTDDRECGTPPIDICEAGACIKGCAHPSGAECQGELECSLVSGRCEPPPSCTLDTECNFPSEVCEAGDCVFGCSVDTSQCTEPNLLCDPSTGRCASLPGTCVADTDCVPAPPARVCESSQCVPGCTEAGGIQCTGAASLCQVSTGRCIVPPVCGIDADCGDPNQICEQGSCVLRCGIPGGPSCTGANVCNATTGRCESTAGNRPIGDPCSSNSQCGTLLCLTFPLNGQNTNVCSLPCSAGRDCPSGFGCTDVAGAKLCLPGTLFTPARTFTTSPQGLCSTANNTCQSGWCDSVQMQCIESCSTKNDCSPYGTECWALSQSDGMGGFTFNELCWPRPVGGEPGQGCSQNDQCKSGVCNLAAGTCGKLCCVESDCAVGESCKPLNLSTTGAELTRICQPKTTAGTGALGDVCNQHSDCESELCAAQDPVSGGTHKCTTPCCKMADCNALPLGGRCLPFPGPQPNGVPTLVMQCAPF